MTERPGTSSPSDPRASAAGADVSSGPTTARIEPSGERFVRLNLRLGASPERVYAAWADPDQLRRWFTFEVRGSLVPGTRSVLVWPEQSVWWDVETADPGRSFVFRWPWLPDNSYVTRVEVRLAPEGYGTRLTLEDGPFDVAVPGVLDAYAQASAGWGEALAFLKGSVDFSIDLRR